MLQKLELKVPPVAVWLVFALLIWLVSQVLPLLLLTFRGHQGLAVLLFVAGGVIALMGVLAFRRAQTTVNPLLPHQASCVVDSGIFKYTRNPMYLGMAVSLLGVAAWWSTFGGYLLVPLFCLYLTHFQIIPEERALLKLFGAPCADYMQRVRRWL